MASRTLTERTIRTYYAVEHRVDGEWYRWAELDDYGAAIIERDAARRDHPGLAVRIRQVVL